MPVPDFQSLMLPVLRAVADREITAADLRQRVASEVGLSDIDLADMLPKGGQTVFASRVAWANPYLQRAGLLEKAGRGRYRITEQGRQVLAEPPERIDLKFPNRYPSYVEWRRGRPQSGVENAQALAPTSDTGHTPEEDMAATYALLNAALEVDLLDRVRELSPAFFES